MSYGANTDEPNMGSLLLTIIYLGNNTDSKTRLSLWFDDGSAKVIYAYYLGDKKNISDFSAEELSCIGVKEFKSCCRISI